MECFAAADSPKSAVTQWNWLYACSRRAGLVRLTCRSQKPIVSWYYIPGMYPTHRPLSSSFWGLPYRILNINHKNELLRGLWVNPKPYYPKLYYPTMKSP